MTYPVVVKGDSMIEVGFEDGDVVFVDCSQEAQDGDIVMAMLNGEHTVKRLRLHVKSWAQRVELIAENKHYQPIVIGEGDEFVVLGVVAGHYRRLK
jgi:DNA polymerase V